MEKPAPALDKAIHPIQILKQGVALWQKKFAQLSALFLAFYVPIFAVGFLMQLGIGPKPAPGQLVWFIPVQVMLGAAGLWAAIALMFAAAQEAEKPLRAITDSALARFWPYVGASIVLGLVTGGPVFLAVLITAGLTAAMAGLGHMSTVQTIVMSAIIFLSIAAAMSAAVILSLRFYLFGFACALENTGPIASLKRSWALTRKQLAPIIGVSLLLGIVFLIVMTPVLLGGLLAGTQPAQGLRLASLVYSYAAYFVVIPLQTCVLLRLYDDLKGATR